MINGQVASLGCLVSASKISPRLEVASADTEQPRRWCNHRWSEFMAEELEEFSRNLAILAVGKATIVSRKVV